MIESVRNSSTTIISLGYIKLSIELEVLVLVLNLASTSILEQGGPEHSSNSLLVEENLAAASLIRFCFLVLNKSWHHDTLTLDHKSWGHPPCGEAREKYSWTFPSSFGTSKCIIGLTRRVLERSNNGIYLGQHALVLIPRQFWLTRGSPRVESIGDRVPLTR